MWCAQSLSPVQLCNPMDCSPPGSYVHGDPPDKNIGVGCHALLQGIFPTQGSNMDLLHCRWFFTIWATREAPVCVCVCVCVCVRKHYGKLDHKVKHADVLIILTHTFGVHYAVLKLLHDKIRKHGCQCLCCSLPLHASVKDISGIQGNKYMYSLLLALSITIIYL